MHYSKIFILVYTSFFLSSCSLGPEFKTPPTPPTSNYTDKPLPVKTTSTAGTAGKAQSFELGQTLPKQWWTLFRSKELNDLIEQGLANSPTVDAAKAAIDQAQQNLRADIGIGLFPNITAQAGATRQLNSKNSGSSNSGIVFNLYNTSINVSYNLDIFGQARRYREQLGAQVDYQQYQLKAAYLTLTSNLVTTAITEASLKSQIEATKSLIQAQEASLNIVQQQFKLGAVSESDILQQKTLLAQTQATLPPLQKNQQQYRNALAILVGKAPSEAKLPNIKLENLTLPEQLPVSLPSHLVEQRPDVLASEALLHAASAGIGVAIGNRFPQFALTGSYGNSSSELNTLFTPATLAWNLGSQVTQTIFNGGALKAKQEAAKANYNQAAAQYKQTVLQAFQNVADALNAIQVDAEALKIQAEAEKAAYASLKLIEQQYKLGAINYLAQLDATRTYQQTRIGRIQVEAARYADTAALFQALGGGW